MISSEGQRTKLELALPQEASDFAPGYCALQGTVHPGIFTHPALSLVTVNAYELQTACRS